MINAYTLARRIFPGRPLRALLYSVIALYHGTRYRDWHCFCESKSIEKWSESYPILKIKPLRSLYASDIGRERRYGILFTTLQALSQRPHLQAMTCGGVKLTEIPLPNHGGSAVIILSMNHRFRREGELCVEVLVGEKRIHSVSGALEKRSDGMHALLLCSQGAPETAIEINAIHKATHGIRPKALAVYSMQWLVVAMGAVGIEAVGSKFQFSIRNSNKLFPFLSKSKRVQFDYDGHWPELGGVTTGQGWFKMPLTPERRSRSAIKPNKRSEYARRYALYDRMEQDIRTLMRIPHSNATSLSE